MASAQIASAPRVSGRMNEGCHGTARFSNDRRKCMPIPESLYTALEVREQWLLHDSQQLEPRETNHTPRLRELAVVRGILSSIADGEAREG